MRRIFNCIMTSAVTSILQKKNRREMNATFEHFSANDLAHVMSILTLTKTV